MGCNKNETHIKGYTVKAHCRKKRGKGKRKTTSTPTVAAKRKPAAKPTVAAKQPITVNVLVPRKKAATTTPPAVNILVPRKKTTTSATPVKDSASSIGKELKAFRKLSPSEAIKEYKDVMKELRTSRLQGKL